MKWTKEQLDAITLSGQNIIVSAGAGSGKTAVLSERVLNKIDNGIHLNELLILTFTKAAALEMKQRIRKKVANNPEELARLSGAYITTFDSFALSIVKKYHYLENISEEIKITDESIIKLTEKKILDDLFEELYELKDKEFLSLIDKYCVKEDGLLKDNILRIAKKINEFNNPEAYLNNIKNNYFTDENIKMIYSDYLNYLEDQRLIIKMDLSNIEHLFDSSYVTKLYDGLGSFLNIEASKLYQIAKVSLPNIPRGSLEETKEAKKNLKDKIDSLLKLSIYGSYDNIKKDIISNKLFIMAIINIIESFNKRLNNYKQDHLLYTFNDIAKLAIKILKNNKEACEELKYGFKEIMIDEYQDTNDIQDELIGLIANNNVYMVGDIKQSIYGFRGSNPYIFKDKYDRYSKSDKGIKIDLIKNFRSRKEVLNNINEIFSLIMDDEIGGALYKKSHLMNYGNLTYDEEKDDLDYNINILEYDNEDDKYSDPEIEIFAIAKDIKDKVGKIKVFDKGINKERISKYSDFVIILDRSKYFNIYKKIFEYLSIPLMILKDDELTNNYDILIIKNLIELIIKINKEEYDEIFKYDFVSILRSFLYEETDNNIANIITDKKYMDTKLFNDLKQVGDINSKTIPELLLDLLQVTDFYNKIVKIGDFNDINNRLEYLYNIANSLNELGYTIENFNDYLEDLIKNNLNLNYQSYTTNMDCVKIMTIHGSKGLEFPFCYFADLNHNFNMRELNDKFVVSNKYGLIIPTNLENEKNSVVKLLQKNLFLQEEISEKERLLYVALTRAREKITIIIPKEITNKMELDDRGIILNVRRRSFTKLIDYIYAIKSYLPKYFSSLNISDLDITDAYLYPKEISKLDIDNSPIIVVQNLSINSNVLEDKHYSKENLSLITNEDTSKMELGLKVHEILEYLDFKNPNYSDIPLYLKDKIIKLLKNPLFNNLEEATIYKEYEFTYHDNEIDTHGIIDLMLEYESHIDIVDYKLKNVDDEEYLKQLRGYQKYIKKISNKEVNIYLYSIMDEILRKLD